MKLFQLSHEAFKNTLQPLNKPLQFLQRLEKNEVTLIIPSHYIFNASQTSDMEYNSSIKATMALTDALFNQAERYEEDVDTQSSILYI